jgi:vacuolar-type H+-ATPase subunit B/Vma2
MWPTSEQNGIVASALLSLIVAFPLQGSYEARSIFQSLDLAWTLLRLFPRELLRRITSKTLDAYYSAEQHQS